MFLSMPKFSRDKKKVLFKLKKIKSKKKIGELGKEKVN